MNKYITILLLGVVVVAMALVLGIHMQHVSDDEQALSAVVSGGSSTQANSVYSAPTVTTGNAPATDSTVRLNLGQPVSSSVQGASSASGIQAPVANQPSASVSSGHSESSSNASPSASPNVSPNASSDVYMVSQSNPVGAGGQAIQTGPTGQNTTASQSNAATSAVGNAANRLPASGVTVKPSSGQGGQGVSRTSATQTGGQASGSGVKTSQTNATQANNISIPASVTRGQGNILQTTLKFRGRGMVLFIEADSPLPVKYFVLNSPERVVVDLPGAWKNFKLPSVPTNMLVKDIRIGRQPDSDRIVIDLNRKVKSDSLIRINDKKVEVFFE